MDWTGAQHKVSHISSHTFIIVIIRQYIMNDTLIYLNQTPDPERYKWGKIKKKMIKFQIKSELVGMLIL